ncbi:hypothetical protein SLA2020_391640 [Shorea laevis]
MAVAARLMQIRRALSLLARNQPPNSLLRESPPPFSPSAPTFLSTRYNFNGRWFQTQTNLTALANKDAEDQEASSLQPISDSSSDLPKTEDSTVKHTAISRLKMSSRHDLAMIFTCKVCETRSIKTVCRESYEKGVVVARCGGCNNLHLISDHLGWFGEPGTVEDFLAARGEEIKKGSIDTLNLTLDDLAGKGVLKG